MPAIDPACTPTRDFLAPGAGERQTQSGVIESDVASNGEKVTVHPARAGSQPGIKAGGPPVVVSPDLQPIAQRGNLFRSQRPAAGSQSGGAYRAGAAHAAPPDRRAGIWRRRDGGR